ncbi:transcription factor TGA1-like [Impatiens glandulifera]|uniref:transcription factor TGA1-like n=1 Tax=Impatiens glandulifera TaxID=253017 RepID=UPI001FB11B05|nr:transcription factor TGA1-like [Impatiens glandulifera]XP_047328564.1 transcription factor TGA1-like [Impatiens glandulifera]
MDSPTSQFVSSRSMGIFEPIHQMSMWGDFRGNGFPSTSMAEIMEADMKLDNQSEDTSHEMLEPSNKCDQEASKHPDKVLRRLAQNREAARKSRMRKKAYVQQLETSRLKLIQVEQELERARQRGQYVGSSTLDASYLGYSATVKNSGINAFEMEYGHWVDEQNKQMIELRDTLNSINIDDERKLQILVEDGMKHYYNLFRMKEKVAKSDVFYIMSGIWKTPAERFLLWMGGFRPSEVLRVVMPQLEVLDEQQQMNISSLAQSCQQAEDALTQGMEKLQATLVEAVAAGRLGGGSYLPQVSTAVERLKPLVMFVTQADHIRQEALQQIYHILTTRQAAQALLALAEYSQRLRALSSLWTTHLRES